MSSNVLESDAPPPVGGVLREGVVATNVAVPGDELETDGHREGAFSRELLDALLRYREGDFSVRLASGPTGVDGKIVDVFNQILATRQKGEAEHKKDLFLATLAHELRNPLAPLRAGLDVLLRSREEATLVERTLCAMNRQLDYMVRLVDDLLDVSRISRGALDIRRERSELCAVIEHAMETAGPAFAQRDQSIAFEPEGPFVALVDATRISQIVANLLNNASKHSPRGARVRVRLRREGSTALVQVVDEGAGIPADQLARVFDMFTKIERSVQGANDGIGIGIGLALSRRLAELHGGTLTAQSAGEGQGATFTLAVPSGVPDPAAEHAPRIQAAKPAARPSARPSLSVVVVEDNEDSAEVMSVWLGQLGHDVRVARTGPDGVALILETRPDVVLCDLGLPGMDGVDVCRLVLHMMPDPPVMVAVTGWGMETDRKRTKKAGFRLHLVKPVVPETLRAVLESIGS